jgi:pentatricopeptide repeat protein
LRHLCSGRHGKICLICRKDWAFRWLTIQREEFVKICPHCQKPIRDDIQVCPLCRMPVTPAYTAGVPQAEMPYPIPGSKPDGKAIGSLVCGIFGLFLPAAIVAVVLGHLSLSEIKRSAGRLTGRGMAIAGLVLGYLGLAVIPIMIIAAIAIPNLLRARMAANEASATQKMKQFSAALYLYQSMCQENIYPDTMKKLGSGQPSCEHANALPDALAKDEVVVNGYEFKYQPGEASANGQILTYTLTADPISPAAGINHYFLDQTTVIRRKAREPADADSTPIGN